MAWFLSIILAPQLTGLSIQLIPPLGDILIVVGKVLFHLIVHVHIVQPHIMHNTPETSIGLNSILQLDVFKLVLFFQLYQSTNFAKIGFLTSV